MASEHTIHWNRAEGHARYVMPPNHGDFFALGSDAWQDVIRFMANAGFSGPCEVRDERLMPCWRVTSIAATARYYRPTDAQKAGEAEYRSWFPRGKR